MNRENTPLKEAFEAAPSDPTMVSPVRGSPNDAIESLYSIETKTSKSCWLKCMEFIGEKIFRELICRGSSLFIILSLIIGIPEKVLKLSLTEAYK